MHEDTLRPKPTKFFYFSKSADFPPGKGGNEFILSDNELNYQELANIKNWRHVLSNFYEGVFEFNGLHYKTVEHAFQGCKISIANKEKGKQFALESNSSLANGNGASAQKNRKMVNLSEVQLAHWDNAKNKIMKDIMRAKFTQIDFAKTVLLATKNAQLWHGTRCIPKTRQLSLEQIRREIQETIRSELNSKIFF